MKLKAVDITPDPDGALVRITGRNAQGKSAVLTCIRALFGGKAADPVDVVRHGEDEARIIGETEDFIVKVKWKSGGGRTMTVESKDGAVFKSPQSMLDKIKGDLTFDPLAFSRMDPKKQKDLLLRLLGLDEALDKMDTERDLLMVKRRDLGRDRDNVVGSLKLLPEPPLGTPEEEVNVSELMGKVAEARKHKETVLSMIQIKNSHHEAISRSKESIESWERAIRDARQDIALRERAIADLEAELSIEALAGNVLETLEAEIASADTVNRNVRLLKQVTEGKKRANMLDREYEHYTEAIKALDKDKERLIRETPFPVEGLTFGPDGVLYNGVPLLQCSSAEQLLVSLAVGMQMNPLLKVLLIQDGSLLDSASLEVVRTMAEKNGYQVWVESVDESGKVGIVIEDGEVKA